MKPYGVPGRGGILNKVLYGKAPPWGPPRYPFIYHFWLKRYPFRISSIDKWYFFNIPIVELCIFLNGCKRTFKISINHNTRTFFRLFHNHKMHLLAPLGLFADRNDRFPFPFIYFNWWKFLPVHILETWERHPNLIPRVLSHPSKGRRENLGTRLRLPEAVNRLNSRPPLDTNWLGYSMFIFSVKFLRCYFVPVHWALSKGV